MLRRSFLGAAGSAALASAQANRLRISTAEIRADLEALSIIGRPAGGSFESGVSRIGYSDADIAGRSFFINLLK